MHGPGCTEDQRPGAQVHKARSTTSRTAKAHVEPPSKTREANASIAEQLRQVFRIARRRTNTGISSKVSLHVSVGHGGLSKALEREGLPTISIDILQGEHFDVLHPEVMRVMQSGIRAGLISGDFLGTPCNTWSPARRAPLGSSFPRRLRTKDRLYGIDGLSPADQNSLRIGNDTSARAVRIIQLCDQYHIPVAEENPNASLL